jgi:hypothetical protein
MANGKLEIDGELIEWMCPATAGGFAVRHAVLTEGQWMEDSDRTAVDTNDDDAVRAYAERIVRALRRRSKPPAS